jgi:hypothetical protein
MVGVPDLEAPGVYIEELPWGAGTIVGVETSTAAFVGRAHGGPTEPVAVSSFVEYQRVFGPPDPERELGHAVRAFLENGGAPAWIVRVAEPEPLSVGLKAIEAVSDLGLLCLPGETDVDILRQALDVPARRGLFLIADAMDLDPQAAATTARALAAENGARNGAFYWPPLRVTDADGSERLLAPSGAVAGVFARVDRSRGIWTAPAGERATVLGTEGPSVEVRDAEVSVLAATGVNAIRAFPSAGIRVWGGRTLSSDPEWRYVNVRRTFLFLEHSIDRGTQWAVFEPNDEPLWARVRGSVGAFLNGLWRQGAFQGQTPQEAFFVRCDRTTMTEDDLGDGRLRVQVGFAALRPAEFVVIEISKLLAAVATQVVGTSTGEPGLELRLPHRWVDPSRLAVMVEEEGGWTSWSAVEDLANSGSTDAHYVVEVGKDGGALLRFGDGEHGAVPPKGARIKASYRNSAGEAGDRPGRNRPPSA